MENISRNGLVSGKLDCFFKTAVIRKSYKKTPFKEEIIQVRKLFKGGNY